MSVLDWRQIPESRTLLYAGRVLDPTRTIAIAVDAAYLSTYAGQCALLVFANLVGRMTRNVVLSFDNAPMHPRLSYFGTRLQDCVVNQLAAADPGGHYPARLERPSDYVVRLGPGAGDLAAIGCGWLAYAGPAVPHFSSADGENPFGAIFAAIMAGAKLFTDAFPTAPRAQWVNTFDWRLENRAPEYSSAPPDVGRLMTVGLGSVGSAALYFLALAGAQFDADLIDFDVVKDINLDRSPIFTFEDAVRNALKVASVERFLRRAGYRNIRSDGSALHASPLWADRRIGEPDILVSAANEKDVRRFIEVAFPPLQIYATTGRNWQVSLIRHIPIFESCSRCLFLREMAPGQLQCSSGAITAVAEREERVDVALPFLSFAAGFMIAAEMFKLSSADYSESQQRTTVSFRPDIQIVRSSIAKRSGCSCTERRTDIHRSAIARSKFAHLSGA
jgi:hypothetical protein